jgi:hypothetical protein
MGKTSKSKGPQTSSSTKASESSQNQGFLKTSGKKAAHSQEIKGSAKSRKGLKSGEPFSSTNHINREA